LIHVAIFFGKLVFRVLTFVVVFVVQDEDGSDAFDDKKIEIAGAFVPYHAKGVILVDAFVFVDPSRHVECILHHRGVAEDVVHDLGESLRSVHARPSLLSRSLRCDSLLDPTARMPVQSADFSSHSQEYKPTDVGTAWKRPVSPSMTYKKPSRAVKTKPEQMVRVPVQAHRQWHHVKTHFQRNMTHTNSRVAASNTTKQMVRVPNNRLHNLIKKTT